MDGWKLIGLLGTGLFAGRWVVQFLSSRRAGRSVVNRSFWMMSTAGSLLLVLYFTVSPHRDVVGLLGNALPLLIGVYNIRLLARPQGPG
jgi:lipid-A-disaccharide synthase-like uncharacterized protein